ncbi:MAG: 50S ribosome-binding GTPase [Pirellulales bacterium]|nr:50S ribosome-binding GTPase [Pirellulales bacterium]
MTNEPRLPLVVPLTPAGRGAIAALLVAGPRAVELVEAVFVANSGRRLAEAPSDRIVVGRFVQEGVPGEPLVARRIADDRVELDGHGGAAAVARLERALVRRGAKSSSWADWIALDEPDPLRADAAVALAKAPTARSAGILLDQYNGALRRAWDALRAALEGGQIATAQSRLALLRGRAVLGRHLVEPWRVVLAGAANVGKSSLMNALMGYRRAIVHPTPGTTRDVVRATAAIDGWPVELSDTAGLRPGGDPVERAGVHLAQDRIEAADLVVWVLDAARPGLSRACVVGREANRSLIAWNKTDLAPMPADGPPGLATVAVTGEGVESLLAAISRRLVPEPPPPGEAVPFTAEQATSLDRAATHLAANRADKALRELTRAASLRSR